MAIGTKHDGKHESVFVYNKLRSLTRGSKTFVCKNMPILLYIQHKQNGTNVSVNSLKQNAGNLKSGKFPLSRLEKQNVNSEKIVIWGNIKLIQIQVFSWAFSWAQSAYNWGKCKFQESKLEVSLYYLWQRSRLHTVSRKICKHIRLEIKVRTFWMRAQDLTKTVRSTSSLALFMYILPVGTFPLNLKPIHSFRL
jgi:hypothetical protein